MIDDNYAGFCGMEKVACQSVLFVIRKQKQMVIFKRNISERIRNERHIKGIEGSDRRSLFFIIVEYFNLALTLNNKTIDTSNSVRYSLIELLNLITGKIEFIRRIILTLI